MLIVPNRNTLIVGASCLAVGGLVGFQVGKAITAARIEESMPDIGIDFFDRKYADQLRQSGDLDNKTLYGACRDAVDNYFKSGLSGAVGKVLVDLPSRDELKQHPPGYYSAKRNPSCDPD
jgi:hypothetical protein